MGSWHERHTAGIGLRWRCWGEPSWTDASTGNIEMLPSGSLRGRVYAGSDILTGVDLHLRKTIPAGPTARTELLLTLLTVHLKRPRSVGAPRRRWTVTSASISRIGRLGKLARSWWKPFMPNLLGAATIAMVGPHTALHRCRAQMHHTVPTPCVQTVG
jgi:hypothetical protein